MTSPRVVNLHKELDTDAIYIGRPSKWGNPFKAGRDGSRAEVIERFRMYMQRKPELVAAAKAELRGKDLACYCAPKACHGDVLLEIANSPTNG